MNIMKNNFELESVYKGVDFWTKEIERAGLSKNLRFFNDVIVENRPPHPESGYGKPVLVDVTLDGHKIDIYHSDKDNNQTIHRLFLHIKE